MHSVPALRRSVAFVLLAAAGLVALPVASGSSLPISAEKIPSRARDTTPPTAPTNLNGHTGITFVQLTWSASRDNVAVAYYRVAIGSRVSRTTATGIRVGRLRPNTSYAVSVRAVDAAGNVSARTRSTVRTLPATAPDIQPPTSPTELAADPDTTSVVLSWAGSRDNVAVTGYTVAVAGQTQTSAATSTTITGLTAATDYTATVTASDAAGNTSAPAAVAFRTDTDEPPGPLLYVATTGLDTNAGTADAPLLTIQAAVDRATPGTTIRVRSGTYDNAQPIRIRTSGTDAAPITIQPADDGPVLLTHPVEPVPCSSTQPAGDRTINIGNGADHWIIEGLTIHNGIWMSGRRAGNTFTWLKNLVDTGNWVDRRAVPGHGSYDPAASRAALVPFLREATGQPDLDPVEDITIRDNQITGRGIHGSLASYGRIAGNTIAQIPCGIGPGIWLLTFSNGWIVEDNDVSDIAESDVHYMQEGIRFGSAADYNEIRNNSVHDLPGDGRGVNTDVDASWNYVHHNSARNVAMGFSEQMSGWGNRWEYNEVSNYRTYGVAFRLQDASLPQPSYASSSNLAVVRCNRARDPMGNAKALGVGAMMRGKFVGNDMPRLWLSSNVQAYWAAQGNSWNGSSAVPPESPPVDPSGC